MDKSKDKMLGQASLTVRNWAAEWHGGQWSGLYSVASTGKYWRNKIEDLWVEMGEIERLIDIPEEVHNEIVLIYKMYEDKENKDV